MTRSTPDQPPLLVVSPHLDDAVFSCGNLLAASPGSLAVTVLAGTPARGEVSTDWDRQCGFASAAEAMRVRRDEDRAALRAVAAEPLWLDFRDRQYDETVDLDRLVAQLADIFGRHADHRLLIPLGLFHSDHLLTHAAARRAANGDVLAYEDAPYRSMEGVLQQRLADLAQNGVTATPVDLPACTDPGRKRRAVVAYASQVPLFGPHGLDDLWRPERVWRLVGSAEAAG